MLLYFENTYPKKRECNIFSKYVSHKCVFKYLYFLSGLVFCLRIIWLYNFRPISIKERFHKTRQQNSLRKCVNRFGDVCSLSHMFTNCIHRTLRNCNQSILNYYVVFVVLRRSMLQLLQFVMRTDTAQHVHPHAHIKQQFRTINTLDKSVHLSFTSVHRNHTEQAQYNIHIQ